MITSLLVAIAAVQAAVSLVLLGPRVVSKPVSKLLKTTASDVVAKTVVMTIAGALALVAATSIFDLSRNKDLESSNPTSKLLASIDNYRAQITTLLSLGNLLLLALNSSLGYEQYTRDFTEKNLEGLKRQVKGLQAEYTRVTDQSKSSKEGAESAPVDTVDYKKQIDKMIQEKIQLQGEIDVAVKNQKTAEAKLEALLSQVKGMDREYDRLRDENSSLHNKVAQLEGAEQGGKKDL